MKYPDLVPRKICKTAIHVRIESEEISNLGEPLQVIDLDLYCNFQDKAKSIMTNEKKLAQITGTAMFPGDMAPAFPTISGGTVTVFGKERRIVTGMKARNPDETVNYSRLDVF